ISLPVFIVAGLGDPEVAVADNAFPAASLIPNASLHLFPHDVGHYTFLDLCTPAGRKRFAKLCVNSVARSKVTFTMRRRAWRLTSSTAPCNRLVCLKWDEAAELQAFPSSNRRDRDRGAGGVEAALARAGVSGLVEGASGTQRGRLKGPSGES